MNVSFYEFFAVLHVPRVIQNILHMYRWSFSEIVLDGIPTLEISSANHRHDPLSLVVLVQGFSACLGTTRNGSWRKLNFASGS